MEHTHLSLLATAQSNELKCWMASVRYQMYMQVCNVLPEPKMLKCFAFFAFLFCCCCFLCLVVDVWGAAVNQQGVGHSGFIASICCQEMAFFFHGHILRAGHWMKEVKYTSEFNSTDVCVHVEIQKLRAAIMRRPIHSEMWVLRCVYRIESVLCGFQVCP